LEIASFSPFLPYRASPEYASCELALIPEKFDFKPYAYGFQKNSPLLGPFNFYLKQLRESGTVKKIIDSYDQGDQVCPDFSGQSLGFASCFTAFVILLGGLFLGLIFFVLETAATVRKCSMR